MRDAPINDATLDKRCASPGLLGGSGAVDLFIPVADAPAAWATTADPLLDPMVTAVLEEAPEPRPMPAGGPEDARLIRFEPQRVVVEAELNAPGVLISSEVFYPGWVARVDGRRVPTLRAFGLLRAVALSPGRWRVEWRYEPPAARIGLGISLVTLVAVGILLCRPRRKVLES